MSMKRRVYRHLRFSIAIAYILVEGFKMIKSFPSLDLLKLAALVVLFIYAMIVDFEVWRSASK